jgi:hypothetical protein
VRAGRLELRNDNFDVGRLTEAGRYRLADAAYLQLLHKLQNHYAEIPQELRSDILHFYCDLSLPISTKTNDNDWARLLKELDHLRAVDMDLRSPAVSPPVGSCL